MKIQIIGGKGVKAKHCWMLSTKFWIQKVFWQYPPMFCLSRPLFEFSLKLKVMWLNAGYLLESFLLYHLYVLSIVIFSRYGKPEPQYFMARVVTNFHWHFIRIIVDCVEGCLLDGIFSFLVRIFWSGPIITGERTWRQS